MSNQNQSSPMMPRNEQNFNNNANAKKLPNPANFKIVKCKNYERGDYLFIFFIR